MSSGASQSAKSEIMLSVSCPPRCLSSPILPWIPVLPAADSKVKLEPCSLDCPLLYWKLWVTSGLFFPIHSNPCALAPTAPFLRLYSRKTYCITKANVPPNSLPNLVQTCRERVRKCRTKCSQHPRNAFIRMLRREKNTEFNQRDSNRQLELLSYHIPIPNRVGTGLALRMSGKQWANSEEVVQGFTHSHSCDSSRTRAVLSGAHTRLLPSLLPAEGKELAEYSIRKPSQQAATWESFPLFMKNKSLKGL